MKVWRISKAKWATKSFSGVGAAKTGGRFNHKGSPPIIYTADSLALASSELWVHLVDRNSLPNFCKISATIPDSISRIQRTTADLPINWDSWPHPESARELGTERLKSLASCLLVVHSVVIPDESNYLINPLHPDFKNISIDPPEPFEFDARTTS